MNLICNKEKNKIMLYFSNLFEQNVSTFYKKVTKNVIDNSFDSVSEEKTNNYTPSKDNYDKDSHLIKADKTTDGNTIKSSFGEDSRTGKSVTSFPALSPSIRTYF